MPIRVLTATSLLASLALIGCGEAPASAEAAPPAPIELVEVESPNASPAATVQEMLALAERGAWTEYVDRFYGEKHKFRDGHNDLEKVAGMLQKRADVVLDGLRRVAELEPVMTDDGAHAVYDLGEGQHFMLFLAEDGRWTFHL